MVEIDNHKKLGLEIVPSDRRAEIDLALDHAAGHRRANLLPP